MSESVLSALVMGVVFPISAFLVYGLGNLIDRGVHHLADQLTNNHRRGGR